GKKKKKTLLTNNYKKKKPKTKTTKLEMKTFQKHSSSPPHQISSTSTPQITNSQPSTTLRKNQFSVHQGERSPSCTMGFPRKHSRNL
ncbi:unnamed protein product, partial [Coccothraustes coccothraustes]